MRIPRRDFLEMYIKGELSHKLNIVIEALDYGVNPKQKICILEDTNTYKVFIENTKIKETNEQF